ncbi:MAG: 4-hydroxy-tetrahydrodipicolinate reductase [Actinomycetota bacterium]|nr:4-hydroxy-tetrahydrodipicolinate reductase [Actinomycetota bacterium]
MTRSATGGRVVRVGVLGALGRMGTTVCDAVTADPDLDLVARVDQDDPLQALVETNTEVAVDFTTPAVVKDNVRFCLSNDIHIVVGTTGWTEADLAEVERWANASQANAFVAPNFALGAVLMMRFAAEAARHYGSGEIIERHHENKLDAPSGTALRTAELMDRARGDAGWLQTPSKESVPGSRGADAGGVRIHSVRVPGSVAHQDVIFGAAGETLTIRHDSLDRTSFMPGVLLAIKTVGTRPGLTVGLEHLLEES